MDLVTLLYAVGAGVLSFLSPCVLPLVPGYISFVSGTSLSELADGAPTGDAAARRRRVIVNTVAFVLGFSIVFVAMGASATYAGQWLAGNRVFLGRIAGTIIVLFGLHVMGVLKIPFLNVEKRFHSNRAHNWRLAAPRHPRLRSRRIRNTFPVAGCPLLNTPTPPRTDPGNSPNPKRLDLRDCLGHSGAG